MRFKSLIASMLAVVSLGSPLAGAEPSTFVRAGGRNACMPDRESLICWGSNVFSQLGQGNADARPHADPERVQGLPPESVRDVQIGPSEPSAPGEPAR